MPCRDYYDDSSSISELQKRNDLLARVACNSLRALEYMAFLSNEKVHTCLAHVSVSPEERKEVAEWWKVHKVADKKRQQKDKAAEKAKKKVKDVLDKLTPEEQVLLKEQGLLKVI